jgi:hypothetical protein
VGLRDLLDLVPPKLRYSAGGAAVVAAIWAFFEAIRAASGP